MRSETNRTTSASGLITGFFSNEMSTTKRNVIRSLYIVSQFISVWAAFAGTLLDLYEVSSNHDEGPKEIPVYIWVGLLSAVAAAIASFTANKFQGAKIGSSHEAHDEKSLYSAKEAPRNFKSNLAEISYLSFATLLLIVKNYFFIAAFKAYILGFKDPENSQPIMTPKLIGLLAFVIKTIAFDLPFHTTNAHFEASEEFKNDITSSKEGSLISLLIKPLTSKLLYAPTLIWIQSAGVGAHTVNDYLDTFINIPAPSIVSLYENTPSLFWLLFTVVAIGTVFLMSVNFIQTLYFEGAESQINMGRVRNQSSNWKKDFHLRKHEEPATFLHKLLRKAPSLKKPIRIGFFAQPIIHGAADMMPVVLFLRDTLGELGTDKSIITTLIVILGGITLIGGTLGTHFSEVATAIHHYDEDFKDIGEPTGHIATLAR